MPTNNEQILSQKINNYNYAPGVASYGIDGRTGKTGDNGNNIYFTDYDITGSLGQNNLQELIQKIANNMLPIVGKNEKVERPYVEGDLFFDRNGVIYKLINKSITSSNGQTNYYYTTYFDIVGKININDDQNYFEFAANSNRLILNATYNGYDILSGVSSDEAETYIDKNTAVNIVSNNIGDNDNIEMVRMQSIDDVDVEDGKLQLFYKTTDNSYHIESNKPIIINGDLKVDNENNIENEYDNYSTVLTSNDPITYFKYLCDKLKYSIIYDNSKNQYFIAIYSAEDNVNKRKQTLQYIYDRNETVFGKIYSGTNDEGTNDIILVKLKANFDNEEITEPYLYSYIPTNIQSMSMFSLIYNTEIFLKFVSKDNIELNDFDYSKYSSIKLMRYNPFYYSILKDENVIIPDEKIYFEYTGETIQYNNQMCYVWKKYNYKYPASQFPFSVAIDEDFKLLTNSLHLSLPFNTNSNEFVAIIISNYEEYNNANLEDMLDKCCNIVSCDIQQNKNNISYDYSYSISQIPTLPQEYQGLCILRKTI